MDLILDSLKSGPLLAECSFTVFIDELAKMESSIYLMGRNDGRTSLKKRRLVLAILIRIRISRKVLKRKASQNVPKEQSN